MKEFGAKLTLKDNMLSAIKKNIQAQKDFSKQVDKSSEAVKKLGNSKANPTVTIKDEASAKALEIEKKLAEIKSKVASPIVRLRDQVSNKVSGVTAKLKKIATTFTPIVKVRDLASRGLAKVKNTLGGFRKPVVMGLALKEVAGKRLDLIKNKLKAVGSTVAKPFVAIKDGATRVLGSVGNKLKTIGSTVARASVAVKDGASAVLGKIGGLLKTLAKGAVIGLTIAGAGIGKSLSEGADLQQSIGGVKTLFKGDAGKVIENANKAFQTTGLSANSYMEQVTSFSASLLQSLGGDTAKASTQADQAMIDMADNANKFGTDMEAITNAYQGFAKQNYTMLDNLKLGYGGTKEEMSRLLSDAQKITGVKYDINNLSDVYSAIHIIQDELDVTGTTANEASTTFSGSLASMKASFSNLMGQLSVGDGDAVARSMGDLLSTASTFLFGNLVPMVGKIFENLPSAMATASQQIAPQIKKNMVPLAKSVISGIKDGLLGLGVDGGLLDGVFDALDPTKSGKSFDFGSIFGTMKQGLVTTINTVLAIMPTLINCFNTVAPVVLNIINTINGAINQIIPYLIPVITTITNIISTAMPIIQQVITIVVNAIVALMPTLSSIFEVVGGAIQQVLSMLGEHMGLFQTIVSVVVEVVGAVWSALAPVISTAVDLIVTVVDGLLTGIEAVFNFLAPYISQIWSSICGFFSSASSTISTIINTLKSVFQTLSEVVSTVFGAISGVISSVCGTVTGIISGVVDKISGFIDTIGKGVDAVKGFVGGVGSKVAGALGFAYGKDRVPYNNYPAMLHEGERVLTRNQADQYDRMMSTRGVNLTDSSMNTGAVNKGSNISAQPTVAQQTPQAPTQKGGDSINLTVEMHVDTVNNMGDVEEMTDKVVNTMVKKLEKAKTNTNPENDD